MADFLAEFSDQQTKSLKGRQKTYINQIKVIEEKIEEASDLGDIDKIRSYGHEHKQLSLELDNVLHQWEGQDSPTP